jgi:type IV fimbrial biogenesis protein FimT
MPIRQATPVRHGFTLVELLITVTIGAVLMALAVPSMQGFIARKRLEGAATELVTDLRYMRAAQLERGRPVRIRFSVTDAKTCYVIFVEGRGFNADCNCGSEPVCANVPSAAESLKVVSLPRRSGIEMRSSPGTMSLQGLNALPAGGTTLRIAVTGPLGSEVEVATNELARPSICSVSGHDNSLTPCTR